MSELSEHHPQYGEMVAKLKAPPEEGGGGFTYNPRKHKFETEGYAVSPYPQHEAARPAAETTPRRMREYHEEHGELLAEKPHMMGGWREKGKAGTQDVLDISKVYPPTGGGQSAARYQAVKHGQRATYAMHLGEEDPNPFHPLPLKKGEVAPAKGFPEFRRVGSAVAEGRMSMSQAMKRHPEISSWVQSPSRRETFESHRQGQNGGRQGRSQGEE